MKSKLKFSGIMYVSGLLLLFISCSSEVNEKYYFTADEISDHPGPDQVQERLHTAPDSAFHRLILGKERFIQLYYTMDSSEFRYKDGKLLEVIVHKPVLPYKPESITRFDLSFRKPTAEDSSAFFRWNKIYDGFDVINFYLVGSKNDDRKTAYKIYFKLN